MISVLANPHRFMKYSGGLMWGFAALAVPLFAVGLYWGLVLAPEDYQQGDSARIMFVHVPAAWCALMAYSAMAVASFVSLVWRHALADVAAKSMAPAGMIFTLICLVTGALWGKPMWGTYWVWDARLTSMLILFFIYLGYLALWAAIDEPQKAARAAAILCLVGVINIPIVKFSVDWWYTLHQEASVFRMDGPAMPMEFLAPLFVMAFAYSFLFGAVTLAGMRAEVFAQRARVINARLANL
jgi:heme exporter protein C